MTLTPMGPGAPPIPPVLAGMPKADALAFVARMFDAQEAGDTIWSDDEIVERFLQQCSRTGSQETRDGYRREINAFRSWLWSTPVGRSEDGQAFRRITPQMAENWVAFERAAVDREERRPRSFSRAKLPSHVQMRDRELCSFRTSL